IGTGACTLNDIVQFVVSSLSLGGLYALMALGLVIVYGILRLINFAYGELVMVGGYSLLILGKTVWPWVVVALLSVAMAVLASVLMERVGFRPVRNASPTTMLITSFAISTLLQNVALLTVSPRPQAVRLPGFFVHTLPIGGLRVKAVDLIRLPLSLILLGLH